MNPRPATSPAVSVVPARTTLDWEHAKRLTGELVDWLATNVGLDARAHQHDSNEELDSLAEFYRLPEGQLLLGYLAGVPSGTAGVHLMTPDTAELRRVWVTPKARGNVIASALLSTAIETARSLGAREIWLETVSGHMDRAIEMYRRAGFRTIPNYTSLPDTLPNVISLGLVLAP